MVYFDWLKYVVVHLFFNISEQCKENEKKSSNCTEACDTCKAYFLQSSCSTTQCTEGEDEKCVCAPEQRRDENGDCIPIELCNCYDTNGMVIKEEDLGLRNGTCIEW